MFKLFYNLKKKYCKCDLVKVLKYFKGKIPEIYAKEILK